MKKGQHTGQYPPPNARYPHTIQHCYAFGPGRIRWGYWPTPTHKYVSRGTKKHDNSMTIKIKINLEDN